MNDQQPTVVDVRTPEEFSEGHVVGSVNIPLNEIPERIEELRGLPTPLILCCRSGARSDSAMRYLQQMGLPDVSNGGSWQEVQETLKNR
ncbi:MAG: rhodanese-like domain-containing protein [Flavobacteriales bacterium]|nr:rhodanese-like domain-containing protein [Flavobacteriales bacterium]